MEEVVNMVTPVRANRVCIRFHTMEKASEKNAVLSDNASESGAGQV